MRESTRQDEINIFLDSENRSLRQQLLRSEDEVARLRRQLEYFVGHHGSLPVIIPTPTVDLSRLDTGLVAYIVSFIGTSIELRNLALTCKSFGWKQTASGLDSSLVEEVARQAVCSGRNKVKGVRITLSPYVRGTAWISILHETEHPLKFDTLLGRGIEHANENKTSVRCAEKGIRTTVATNFVMVSGIHYAEFQITGGRFFIGVVRPMPNLDPDRFANDDFHFYVSPWYNRFLATRTDEWGSGNVHACHRSLYTGRISWTNWAGEEQLGAVWEGRGERCGSGDTVGMLLNLDNGTLTAYKNNRLLGVMKDGLSGSYCWYTTVLDKCAISVERCDPPMA